MKIGVITFLWTKDNYGQVLQAWALQHVLEQMGHHAYVIQYEKCNYRSWKKIIRFPIELIKDLFSPSYIKYKKQLYEIEYEIEGKNEIRHFDSFKQKYIKMSNRVYNSLDDLQKNPPLADCYITGSDQVWAQLLSDKNNEAYFLDFGPKFIRRISYAPSFAMSEYPQELRKRLQKNLARFDYISVREPNGINICHSVGFNAHLVLDPTLLLTGEFYLKNLEIPQTSIHKYIFVYSLNVATKEELNWKQIKAYAKSKKLDLVVTPSTGAYLGCELFEDVKYSYATIEQWLRNISSSDLVVTPSFHGIVFSILLKRPFVYMPLKNSFSRANDRVLSLLDKLDLKGRIYNENLTIDQITNTTIDWNNVLNTLSVLRVNSFSFLRQALS